LEGALNAPTVIGQYQARDFHALLFPAIS
jgi:hypothetical protein